MPNKKKFTMIKRLQHSIKIDEFYQYAIHEPLHKGILYLLLLSLILSLPFFVVTSRSSLNLTNELKEVISSPEFPEYSIVDGTLVTDPHDIFSFELKDNLVIIDPTDTYNLNDLINKGKGFLFNSTAMIMINKGYIPMTFKYADYKYYLLYLSNSTMLAEFLSMATYMVPFTLFFYSIIKSLFTAIITTFTAFVFLSSRKHIYGVKLKKRQTLTIAIYGNTLAFIVYSLLMSLPIPSFLLSQNGVSFLALSLLFLTLSYYSHNIIMLLSGSKTDYTV